MNYWLMKTEPDNFSIDSLKDSPNQTSCWEGVRNYQARNFMRDQMRNGDKILIYHSSCKNVGVAGIAKVVKESYPDHTSWDQQSDYFDPKSTKDEPRWFMVDVKWEKSLNRIITLKELKKYKEDDLKDLLLLKRSRLSIIPLSEKDFQFILGLE